MNDLPPKTAPATRPADLDPEDWESFRVLGHRMLDDMIDHLRERRAAPVWQPLPPDLRASLRAPLPVDGAAPEAVYARFRETILPYSTGNTHPRFMGWVHGGGTPLGMLAEMLAGGLNANLGGRDHAPIEAERQVIAWAAQAFGLPPGAGGLLVTGSSMANFIAVLMARQAALGPDSRERGIGAARLTAYASQGVHRCVPDAMDMAGLGSAALRRVPVGPDYRMDISALRAAIAADRAAGATPFLVIGTAGSVDVGAFDDLTAIADIAAAEGLWFHVDGAFGALAALSPVLAPKVAGMERARSIAFDFHKWAQAPYDAGCILVRDQQDQVATFATKAGLPHRRHAGACRQCALAGRSRPRPLPRLPRAETLVRAAGLRRGPSGRGRRALLRRGTAPRRPHHGRARA